MTRDAPSPPPDRPALGPRLGPVRRSAGRALRSPEIADDALVARDGARLPGRLWGDPEGAGVAFVGLHSFGDVHDGFDGFGRHFAGRRAVTFAYDQRGFGRAPNKGLWPGATTLIADLEDAVAGLAALCPRGTPVVVVGESMGGAVALAASARRPLGAVAGLTLLAPGVRLGQRRRWFWDPLVFLVSGVAPGYGQAMSPPLWDTMRPDTRARHAGDPRMLRFVRADFYKGLLDLMDGAADVAGGVLHPLLVLHGDADRLLPRSTIELLMRRLPSGAEFANLPGAGHLPLQETGAERAFAEVAAWLERRKIVDLTR